MTTGQRLLALAAALNVAAALAHLAVIVGGPSWYRFFGAGERMAHMAEMRRASPVVWTVAIAAILLGWAAYAASGAGLLPRLPLLRTALVAITAVYLIRGLALVVPLAPIPGAPAGFWLWSSAIVLVFGIVHAAGLWLAWPWLRP